MKKLLTTESGSVISLSQNTIDVSNYDIRMFWAVNIDLVRMCVLRNTGKGKFFGVLIGDNACSVHMSVEEAEKLHELLPGVEFKDERDQDALRKKRLSELAGDWLKQNCLILDTETTGLGDEAEIVEISVIDAQGNTLLNSLVKPSKRIPAEATAIHGITDEMVAGAPTWDELHNRFVEIISNTEQPLVIYNDSYDVRILNQAAFIYGLPPYFTSGFIRKRDQVHCAMLAYSEFYGDWDNYRYSFRWQKLTNAVQQCGLEVEGAHRSLSDCQMTLQVLQFMAANGGAA